MRRHLQFALAVAAVALLGVASVMAAETVLINVAGGLALVLMALSERFGRTLVVAAAGALSGAAFLGIFRRAPWLAFALCVAGGAAAGAVVETATGFFAFFFGDGAVFFAVVAGAAVGGALSKYTAKPARNPPRRYSTVGLAVGALLGAALAILDRRASISEFEPLAFRWAFVVVHAAGYLLLAANLPERDAPRKAAPREAARPETALQESPVTKPPRQPSPEPKPAVPPIDPSRRGLDPSVDASYRMVCPQCGRDDDWSGHYEENRLYWVTVCGHCGYRNG